MPRWARRLLTIRRPGLEVGDQGVDTLASGGDVVPPLTVVEIAAGIPGSQGSGPSGPEPAGRRESGVRRRRRARRSAVLVRRRCAAAGGGRGRRAPAGREGRGAWATPAHRSGRCRLPARGGDEGVELVGGGGREEVLGRGGDGVVVAGGGFVQQQRGCLAVPVGAGGGVRGAVAGENLASWSRVLGGRRDSGRMTSCGSPVPAVAT